MSKFRIRGSAHRTVTTEPSVSQSAIGHVSRWINSLSGRLIVPLLNLTEPYSLDDRSTLDNMWIACKRGSRPFLWVPNPNTEPQRFYLMKTPPGFSKDRLQTHVVMEQTTIQMQEQIPIYDVETNG